nr:AbrB family transcriptional regulator [Leptolyngbya sp. FACHB-36]
MLWIVTALELVLAFGIGLGISMLGLEGGAWILGGIAAGAIVFLVYRRFYAPEAAPNRRARKLGQLIIGLSIGLSLQHSNFQTLASQLPVFLGLPLVLMLSGGVIGLLYAQIERTDLLTAMLATTPGNIGVMASMAADYGKNPALVSLVQLLRFTAVIFVMPIIANVSVPHASVPIVQRLMELFSVDSLKLLSSSLVFGVALLAVYLGSKINIPIAAFFCSILVGLLFDLASVLVTPDVINFSLPPIVTVVGQILLGVTIGEYWAVNPVLNLITIVSAAIPVAMTFFTSLMAAGMIKLLTPWDWLTCLLVSAPGGSPEMIWIALALHHDVEIVTAGHLVRLLTINLSLPLLVSLASSWERRRMPQSELVD